MLRTARPIEAEAGAAPPLPPDLLQTVVAAVGDGSGALAAKVLDALSAAGVEHADDLIFLDQQLLLDVGLAPRLVGALLREVRSLPASASNSDSGAAWRSKRLLCRLSPELCGAVPIGLPGSPAVCSELSSSSVHTDTSDANAVAQFNRGQSLAALGMWTQAIGHYESALDMRPRYGAAAAQLGVALMHAGRLSESVVRFRTALEAAPSASNSMSALRTEHNMRLAAAKLHAEEFVATHGLVRVRDRNALFRSSLRRAKTLRYGYGDDGDNGGTGEKRAALFLEFGVFRGDSLRVIAREISGSGETLHAFDSFDGLPEDWEIASPHHLANAPRGTFALREKHGSHHDHHQQQTGVVSSHGSALLRKLVLGDVVNHGAVVRLHVGLFNATLPRFLEEVVGDSPAGVFVAFAHVDCDLESSARFVLQALRPFVVAGTVIQFDELIGWPGWETTGGEYRALRESGLRFRWAETAGQAVSVVVL